jgi:hypothetical protein
MDNHLLGPDMVARMESLMMHLDPILLVRSHVAQLGTNRRRG